MLSCTTHCRACRTRLDDVFLSGMMVEIVTLARKIRSRARGHVRGARRRWIAPAKPSPLHNILLKLQVHLRTCSAPQPTASANRLRRAACGTSAPKRRKWQKNTALAGLGTESSVTHRWGAGEPGGSFRVGLVLSRVRSMKTNRIAALGSLVQRVAVQRRALQRGRQTPGLGRLGDHQDDASAPLLRI